MFDNWHTLKTFLKTYYTRKMTDGKEQGKSNKWPEPHGPMS